MKTVSTTLSAVLRRWQACSSSSFSASSSSSSHAYFLRHCSSVANASSNKTEKPPLKNIDMKINFDISDDVHSAHSLDTANSKEILKHKISHHVKNFQVHPMDTGSTGVQS